MPNYRRFRQPGGTYFFTVVTHDRKPILCTDDSQQALGQAIRRVQKRHPFNMVAWVIMPDHLHCVWELPDGDSDFSARWRLIKTHFTTNMKLHGEDRIWQPRFWEQCIRDQDDFNRHVNYIHFNPVKHGLVENAGDWPYSSYRKFVDMGVYCDDSPLMDTVEIPGAE